MFKADLKDVQIKQETSTGLSKAISTLTRDRIGAVYLARENINIS